MANLRISNVLRSNMLDEITGYVGASGILEIYAGTQPGGGGAEGTLLVTLTFSATFAPAASAGVLTLNSVTSGVAVANGTASWFRIYQSDGTTWVIDGDISTQALGTGDLQLDSTSIVSGATVDLSGPNTFSMANAP